ncbi:MAG: response regulator [Actinobacteria bacterium]|nr:response regulator [Actinomycetota bacterium]
MTDHELLEARAQIARLQRRVERERAARRESEEVAERSLRRLYARQRALDLLTRSAAASNSASDDQAAFTEVMTMIVEEYEWNVGHLLVPARDDPSVLVSSGLWVGRPEDPFFRAVRAATVAARFGPGVGIPGRVMVHGPRWENEPTDLIPARKDLLTQGSVFAFGVMVESVLVGVLEFLSSVPKPEDPDLVELATPMGEQLGRVIERAKAREAQESHRVELERTVKERTDDLRKARDRAEALARARSALFNTVTHELSTPIHAAQAALQNEPVDATTAASQLNLLAKRIDALVAVASESAQGTVEKPTMRVLADMVTDTCAAQRALITPQGGSLTLTVDPSAAEEVLIDTERVRTAIDTLMAGLRLAKADAEVGVRVHLAGHRAVLDFRSPGVRPDDGSLQVVRSACEAASGSMDLRGSTIELSFPVSRPRLQRSGGNRRILLVDDTKVTQRLASAMLSDAGLEVDVAGDGVEAIEALTATPYGVVLMDIRMPRMDGLEATRRIRSGEAGDDRAETPIVAMTADTAPGAAEQVMLAGLDAFVPKPFTKETLLALVARYLPAQ